MVKKKYVVMLSLLFFMFILIGGLIALYPLNKESFLGDYDTYTQCILKQQEKSQKTEDDGSLRYVECGDCFKLTEDEQRCYRYYSLKENLDYDSLLNSEVGEYVFYCYDDDDFNNKGKKRTWQCMYENLDYPDFICETQSDCPSTHCDGTTQVKYECIEFGCVETRTPCKWGCENGICQKEPDKITIYRLQDNNCKELQIYPKERTPKDYDTLEECEEHIEHFNWIPLIAGGIIVIFISLIIYFKIKKK